MCQQNSQVVAWVYLGLFQRWKPQSSPCHWYGTIVCYPPLLDAHNHGLRVAHQFSRTSTHTIANLRYPAPPVHYINHNYVSPVWHHWVLLCKAGVGGPKLALLQPSATIHIFYMYMYCTCCRLPNLCEVNICTHYNVYIYIYIVNNNNTKTLNEPTIIQNIIIIIIYNMCNVIQS